VVTKWLHQGRFCPYQRVVDDLDALVQATQSSHAPGSGPLPVIWAWEAPGKPVGGFLGGGRRAHGLASPDCMPRRVFGRWSESANYK
jgi:hypothetical protein